MRIEPSSISCGIRRLVVEPKDEASKDALNGLINSNRNGCAMIVTGIPTKRNDFKELLLASGFEKMKQPLPRVPDPTLEAKFDDFAFMIRNHGEELYQDDKDEADDANFEQFVATTVEKPLFDFATTVLHHGEYIGGLNFYVFYTNAAP